MPTFLVADDFRPTALNALRQRARLRSPFQARVRVLNDESRFEPSDFTGKPCSFDRIQHGVEVLVGRWRFVLRILAAVSEDVVGDAEI
jgi:hypothetical protein